MRNQSLFDRSSSPAQKADIARYEILAKHGGVFLDMDMECLRALDPLVRNLNFFAGEEWPGVVAIGMLGSVPHHPLLEELIDRLPASCIFHRSGGVNMQTGPGLMTRVVNEGAWSTKDGVRILPPSFFYPYHWTEPWRRAEEFRTAYAVHRWAHSWRTDRAVDARWSDVHVLGRRGPRRVWAVLAEGRRWAKGLARSRLLNPSKGFLKRYLRRVMAYAPRGIQAVPFGSGRLLVRGPCGTRLLCPTSDLSLSPELATEGTYDAAFVEFLERVLRPGMTFVDVGANVGLFTLVAAQRVGRGGRVVAYECNPEVLEFLNANVAMNWFDGRVIVVPRAASCDRGLRKFHAAKEMKGLSGLVLPVGSRSSRGSENLIQVECERLDEGLSGYPFIDLMKVDVEGGEAQVLAGARGLIAGGRVGMLSLEYRLDVLDEPQRRAMENELEQLEAAHNATFHVPGSSRRLPLDEVLTVAHFPQLLVRFPGSSIRIESL